MVATLSFQQKNERHYTQLRGMRMSQVYPRRSLRVLLPSCRGCRYSTVVSLCLQPGIRATASCLRVSATMDVH